MEETQKKNIHGMIVYIDNEFYDSVSQSTAQKLKANIISKNIACFTYPSLPNIDWIKHNQNIIQFVIIDWFLWDEKEVLPSEETDIERAKRKKEEFDKESENIQFINLCMDLCLPVVIFTQSKEDEIENKLIAHGFIKGNIEEKPLLLVFQKTDDIDQIVEKWYNKVPSAKVFDLIRTRIIKAEKDFFADLIVSKNSWIKAIWNNYCLDYGIDQNAEYDKNEETFGNVFSEFSSYIVACIKNRIQFSNKILDKDLFDEIQSIQCNKEDAIKMMECSNFVKNDKISPISIAPGDLFQSDKNYCINVRAECDTARSKSPIKLYLLKGEVIKIEKFVDKNICSICLEQHEKNSPFIGNHNQILYNDTNFTIPFIDEGKIIQFKFKDMFIAEYNCSTNELTLDDKKYQRVGRVLPPYSNKIQQRYAEYSSRIGLRPIPEIIIKDEAVNNQ